MGDQKAGRKDTRFQFPYAGEDPVGHLFTEQTARRSRGLVGNVARRSCKRLRRLESCR